MFSKEAFLEISENTFLTSFCLGAFSLDLAAIEGRVGGDRLSEVRLKTWQIRHVTTFDYKRSIIFFATLSNQVGPQLVEHDLQDIIDSDPVTLPLTRTGLARLQ